MKSFTFFWRDKSYEIQAETIDEARAKLKQMDLDLDYAEACENAKNAKNEMEEEDLPLKFFTVLWGDKKYEFWAKTHGEALKKARELDSELDAHIEEVHQLRKQGIGPKDDGVEVLFTNHETGEMFE